MAATLCGKLLPKPGWLPLTQSIRHGSKAVTRHRKPLHILKQKLLAVTQYIPPERKPPHGAYPPVARAAHKEESGLALLLKKQARSLFQDHRMVAVVQNNSTKAEDMLLLKHRLYKHGVAVKLIPNQVMRSFLADSPYSNMATLFMGPTVMFVSKEPKAKEVLQVLRSSPQMVLLGACIEDTLLSHQGVVSFSKLPTMTTIQGELVSGLSMLTSQTASLLHRHPAHLTALLQQYIKQQGAEGGAEGDPKADAPATD